MQLNYMMKEPGKTKIRVESLKNEKEQWDRENHKSSFDIDSNIIGIDNRCSACISHDKKDFIDSTVKLTNKQI